MKIGASSTFVNGIEPTDPLQAKTTTTQSSRSIDFIMDQYTPFSSTCISTNYWVIGESHQVERAADMEYLPRQTPPRPLHERLPVTYGRDTIIFNSNYMESMTPTVSH